MKHILATVVLTALIFTMLGSGPTASARAWGGGGCSVVTTAGNWAFSYSGVGILPSGPVSVGAVGKFHQDPAGNVTGDEINNLGGSAAYQTLTGKITVNGDCSGTLVANVYQGTALVRTSYIHLQYASNVNTVYAMFQKLLLPNGTALPVVINIDGKRVSSDRDQ
jgi:hypothetical protein